MPEWMLSKNINQDVFLHLAERKVSLLQKANKLYIRGVSKYGLFYKAHNLFGFQKYIYSSM